MSADEIQARRASYVAGMRRLMEDMVQSLPDAEIRGIATRVQAVLAAQEANLEAFASLDLSPQGDPQEALEVFVRAEHLPRMIVSFSKVLQEEGSKAWVPARRRATELAHELALVLQAWALSLPAPPEGPPGEP